MSEITTVGLDLAKNVFQLHGADARGGALLRKKLRRAQVLAFFATLPPCVVAMEACGGAHFWGRELVKLGHDVRLIPPAYVKPFVKRQKNDANDAEAICEAAQRPSMRFVPIKSEEIHVSTRHAMTCCTAIAVTIHCMAGWATTPFGVKPEMIC
jgi:transposase